ncbi:hypothetical protein RvY_09004 [Ramazzottius varieornatus]|uniref:Uncharacterized protein n=1 Tax=Ramazzottius varieornatus TaxID=947166 RepID=A0A1D1V7W6_RAMVA|nr:hypothetical protein RvY_09004 [Ramazzottius varieornatus]
MYLLLPTRAHGELKTRLLPIFLLLLSVVLTMDDRFRAAGQLSGPVRKCVRDENGLRSKIQSSPRVSSSQMSFDKPPELQPLRRKRQLSVLSNSTSAPFDCGFKPEWIKLDKEFYPQYIKSGSCTEKICYGGLYECLPVSATVLVVRWPTDPCVDLNSKDPAELPWVDQKIVSDCKCGKRNPTP